jgi:uncharacterized membrane protein
MRILLRALSLFCLSLLAGLLPAEAQTKAPTPSEGFRICNWSGQEVELATAVDLGDQGGAGKYRRLFVRVDTGNSASWTYNLQP